MRSFLAQLRPRLTGVRRPYRIAGAAAAALLVGTCSQPPPVLEQIRATGVLKVVTRNSPTAYYLGVAGPEGPEYELASGFAHWLGVKVAFTVARSGAETLNEIAHNRAHIAAAGIIASEERRTRLSFGPVYQTVKQYVVHRQQAPAPREAGDLVGKRIEVIAASTHAAALAALARGTPGLDFVEVGDVDQLDLFDRVSSGDIDYTIADSTEYSIGRHLHPELRTAFELAQSESIAWALSPRDGSLLTLVIRYFRSLEQDGTLASMLQRYYAAADRFDYVDSLNFVRIVRERLPALRPFFEEAALASGFDWRLLAAIGYQESKFGPEATSPTGVRGIMMLTERTAARVGVRDRLDPRASILGGARYLQEVRDKFPDRIAEPDRTWLALAAYNIGFAHLEDARILTQRRGGNPDSWNDVRRNLPLLAQERWFMQARNGYARGWEPVRLVDKINNYRNVLVWMTADPGNELRLGTAEQPEPDAD